ncbi:hypothetical protein GCM10010201_08700 [Pilimelia columellifera subsp. columellifera]|uniref:Uncharacterized protein n=1 Tax=Pilimelia columellifera subsp. columellifera TaxID=706583 RepID=A0ABP6AGW3_9ACTN
MVDLINTTLRLLIAYTEAPQRIIARIWLAVASNIPWILAVTVTPVLPDIFVCIAAAVVDEDGGGAG